MVCKRLQLIGWLGAVCLCWLAPALAFAQSKPADDATERAYQELVRKGLHETDLEHWDEAKAYFKEAHAMHPSARTLRGLALTANALRDYVEAITLAGQALASDVRPLTADMRVQMNDVNEQARHFVARVRVRLDPGLSVLRVDGRVPVLDADGYVLLNPGSHELVAQAPGFETVARTVNAQSGDTLQLDLALRAESGRGPHTTPAAAPVESPSPPASALLSTGPAPSRRASIAPWIVVAASGAVAVTGIVLFAMSESDISRVEDAKKGTSWADVKDADDRAPALSAVGLAMIGAGAVGIGVGLAWRFWPESAERASAPGASLALVPGGARIAGRF